MLLTDLFYIQGFLNPLCVTSLRFAAMLIHLVTCPGADPVLLLCFWCTTVWAALRHPILPTASARPPNSKAAAIFARQLQNVHCSGRSRINLGDHAHSLPHPFRPHLYWSPIVSNSMPAEFCRPLSLTILTFDNMPEDRSVPEAFFATVDRYSVNN